MKCLRSNVATLSIRSRSAQAITLASLPPRGSDAYCSTSSAIRWKYDGSNATVDRLPSAKLLRNSASTEGAEPCSADHVTDFGDDRLRDQQLLRGILQQSCALEVVTVRAVEGGDQRPRVI